jgi:hypothetical protein
MRDSPAGGRLGAFSMRKRLASCRHGQCCLDPFDPVKKVKQFQRSNILDRSVNGVKAGQDHATSELARYSILDNLMKHHVLQS